MHFWRRYNESKSKCKVIPWVTAEKVLEKLATWQLFLNLYRIGIVLRGGSRAAATSKMKCFVIIVNGWLSTDSRTFFLLIGKHYWNWRNPIFKKILPGEDYSCKWTTDFLASGNYSFSTFQIFLPVTVFFVMRKSIFEQNPSFRIVETDLRLLETVFFCSEVFPPSGNRHWN